MAEYQLIGSLLIFIVTIILVIKRPFRIGIGIWALIGALATAIIGVTTFSDLVEVWSLTWNATFTFVAIIILSLIYDEAGFFEYSAMKIAKFSGNSAKRLFILMILLGAVTSAFFANDGAVLVLTPIIFSMLSRSEQGINKGTYLAFIISIGFISDTASIPFTISNLVNILMSSYFGIDFLTYMTRMIIPDIAAVLTSLAVLYLFYRNSLPESIVIPEAKGQVHIRDNLIFKTAVPVLLLLTIAYSVTGVLGIPIAIVAVPAVTALFLLVAYRRRIDARKIVREAPWQIVLFSIGMYIIVLGLGNMGLVSLISSLIEASQQFPGPLPVLLSGYLFAFLAAVMNNLPSVMLGNLSIHAAGGSQLLAYANVISNDIGPKFTPIGSLATLLWLYTLNRKKGLEISYRYYMKVGFITALPVLTVTLLTLWFVSLF